MDIKNKQFRTKQQLYEYLNKLIDDVIFEIDDEIAILSTSIAILKEFLEDINWIGFYLIKNNRLVIGPYQGKSAVVYIEITKGVCGQAVRTKSVQRINNVHQFCNHIACDLDSKSELVIPIILNDQVYGVLDIDSPIYNRFDELDENALVKISDIICNKISSFIK